MEFHIEVFEGVDNFGFKFFPVNYLFIKEIYNEKLTNIGQCHKSRCVLKFYYMNCCCCFSQGNRRVQQHTFLKLIDIGLYTVHTTRAEDCMLGLSLIIQL